MAPVIVFGPTGNIGSVAARTAAEQGADVVLAMRDVSKTIPGLSKSDEEAGRFSRVTADLQNPQSVEDAVKSSGAKRAFAYLAFGSPDHMKSTFEAMKAGGIDFVVLLSSFTIGERALDDVPPSEIIPFIHARAEASLDAVFGADSYVAVRPGGFATNILRWKDGIVSGHVRLFGEHFEQDGITAGDMGRVSGTILVSGPRNNQRHVFLYGPQINSQQEAIGRIGKALGKDIKITPLSEEDGMKVFLEHGIPKPVADYLVRATIQSKGMDVKSRFANYETGVANVKLYTGRESSSFDTWIQENKHLFA